MSFGNLKTDESIQEDGDRRGGGQGPLDSGLYHYTINMAYQTESQGGALGVVLHLGTEDWGSLISTDSSDCYHRQSGVRHEDKTEILSGVPC